jgi:hypothetical protein
MLPFGSITSIIPLFVLGFAYLLYFSTSLLSKPEAGADQLCVPLSESGKKEIVINTDRQISYPFVSFSVSNRNFSNSAETTENPLLFRQNPITLIPQLQDLQKHVLKPCYYHFSVRPPPAR